MITEAEWQRQVTDLAGIYGWSWAHFRPARTKHGWKVPVSGPLGAGWPDLVLVKHDRIIFAELKRSARDQLRPDQVAVHDLVRGAVEVYVWRPEDLSVVVDLLAGWATSPGPEGRQAVEGE